MSSMRGVALTVLLVTSTAGSTQSPYSVPAQSTAMAAPAYGSSVGYSLNDWRRLRQNSGYTFADYARFLNANPGWPEESKLRGWRKRRCAPVRMPAWFWHSSRTSSRRPATAMPV
ncbi:hypothetical protein H9L15_11540 [Sphingomonas daechungensis]|uniref:Helix-hairpin-helix domain-containing protein n=1 Tax=Sphingomonas daechungensis TaxID=1176646 RepID=A0ABX6T526_9SPHN|nr:hypothetical protein [Sphingomonas daechungensis]QNP42738.1 hypothetical protein H9L15_11540 [Sphingomonas daechungensis]